MFVDRPDKPTAYGDDGFERLLAEALQPEPLPEHLVGRIRRDWERRRASDGQRLRLVRIVGGLAALAAAACLVLVFMPAEGPGSQRQARIADQRRPVVTPTEAAEILAAIDTLSWDGSADDTLAAVGASLRRLERSLAAGAGGEGRAWDDPPTIDEESHRGILERERPEVRFAMPRLVDAHGGGSSGFTEDWS